MVSVRALTNATAGGSSARAECSQALQAATRNYEHAGPDEAEAYRTYSSSIAAAERAALRAITESAQIAAGDRDRAYRTYRHSGGWLGEAAPKPFPRVLALAARPWL